MGTFYSQSISLRKALGHLYTPKYTTYKYTNFKGGISLCMEEKKN